ncbi:MAG TPA: hypothetical protein VMF04_01775 [Thermoplasmata archaeon]|nr:hypothetical protein [Thermoplasmata archaeon]
MAVDPAHAEEEELLAQLRDAVAKSSGRPREIEVGIALSIALGRRRPSVSCGGCKNPLDFEGIPARTNARLREPFRLLFDGPTDS